MIPATINPSIPATSDEAIARVRAYEEKALELPQVEIATDHVLHGGLYSRTIRIPAGVLLTGVFIRIPTLIVFNGRASVTVGDHIMALDGYHVIPAMANRKQAYLAQSDTDLTMVFPTDAKSVEEAEDQFTDEAHLLFSRKPGSVNHVTITGE